MIKRVIFCLLFALLFLTACLSNGGSVEKTVGEEEEKPEKLVVYLNASSHTFVSQESGEEVFTYYPSTYSLGTMPTGGEFNSPRGNIFEQALAEYAGQTGIPIEVHYVEEYVGDSDVDMLTAHNAGLRSCGVLWGFRSADELKRAGACDLVSSAAELERLILK